MHWPPVNTNLPSSPIATQTVQRALGNSIGIPQICAASRSFASPEVCHNPLPRVAHASLIRRLPHHRPGQNNRSSGFPARAARRRLARFLRCGSPGRPACVRAEHWSTRMKHQRDFKRVSDVALREAAQVSALISDLDRAVRIINQDIAAEEERARVSERTAGHAPDLFERGWTLNDTE